MSSSDYNEERLKKFISISDNNEERLKRFISISDNDEERLKKFISMLWISTNELVEIEIKNANEHVEQLDFELQRNIKEVLQFLNPFYTDIEKIKTKIKEFQIYLQVNLDIQKIYNKFYDIQTLFCGSKTYLILISFQDSIEEYKKTIQHFEKKIAIGNKLLDDCEHTKTNEQFTKIYEEFTKIN